MDAKQGQECAARERILLAAHDLFYRDGVRATGVDALIAAAGVAKATFYRQFPSKDDAIRAFLDYRHERWMHWFEGALARHRAAQTVEERAREPLAPVAAAMREWFCAPEFRGCAFINSVAELGDSLPQGLEIAARHKEEMTVAIAALLPSPDPMRLARAAALIVDGAIVRAQTGGPAVKLALGSLDDALAALTATRPTKG
jgi:AcrR family transcriptional regulator